MLLVSVLSFAQMDTEHWFAPMGSNYPETRYANQALYLSTGATAPFNVDIYNNGIVIGSVSISRNNPGVFNIPRDYIITENDTEKMAVGTKGLYLKGSQKFFATIRFSVINHAEIVTAKGKAALGTEFYAGMPQVVPGYNTTKFSYMIGILASEDNTQVRLSDYNTPSEPKLTFVDGSTDDYKDIRLNKGESYIIEANNQQSSSNNVTNGLIGAKITSNKPISVSNGSFSGRIVVDSGVDIFMDQAIPVDKLGNEHIVINGKGRIPSPMEQALVIATQDNTQVFINNSTTPITSLNKGESYFISSSNYLQNPVNNEVYSLYIRTTENVYVYQLLAGVQGGSEYATGGFNLIPHVDCFLPSSIDQLGNIDINPVSSSDGKNVVFFDTMPTKLNILAQTGAILKVFENDNELASVQGPYSVPGTSSWVNYSVPDIKGNITIQTINNRAITAGIAAGNGNVGYGGYFAGVSSVPSINRSGDCSTGNSRLEVDSSYDAYQWFSGGIAIAGATSYYYETSQHGNYSVRITKTNCSTVETKTFTLLPCPQKSEKTFTIGSCNEIKITPEFTSSTQNVNPGSVTLTTRPQNGNVSINPGSGEITYTVTSPDATSDSFVYYFEGASQFYDSEYVTVNISIKRISFQNGEISVCIADGKGIYNLTSVTVSNDADIQSITYFEDINEALNPLSTAMIPTPEAHLSAPGKAYARITNSFNCFEIAEILLSTPPAPAIESITVKGNSITINASGGTPPYLYTWEKLCSGDCDQASEFSTDNHFTNIPLGLYTAYLMDSKGCVIASKEFINLDLINTITPNGDGHNDTLNYEDLTIKQDVRIQVYDRYGKMVFSNNNGELFWNGKINGRNVETGNYWYLLSWTEPDTGEKKLYKSWILVKNR